jgi:hypothetical protein
MLLALCGACAQADAPGAEIFENGAYHARPVSSYTISGARDGASTDVNAVFTLENGDRLVVELRVAYNPTPVLARGQWRREGSLSEEGDVREESLKFLGGQGATPSVGGRFRLETNGETRWRVVMPTQPLKK